MGGAARAGSGSYAKRWLIWPALTLAVLGTLAAALLFAWPQNAPGPTRHDVGSVGEFDVGSVTTVEEGAHLRVPKDQEKVIRLELDDAIPKIDDGPWPAFPSDLTSIMTVVATQCQGTVLVFEKMYENRLFWVDRLIGMGARIILCDLHRAVVVGPSRLSGSYITTPDIRAGMALLIAALSAEGMSEIHNIQQIDRGYEAIDARLAALGARIRRERV